MTFTCDRCNREYSAEQSSAVAHLYLRDSRCNHVVAHCRHCGMKEIIFLSPRQMAGVIREGKLGTAVAAEASPELRIRAEKAWLAAEEKEQQVTQGGPVSGGIPAQPEDSERSLELLEQVQTYELTPRQENLVSAFGETLRNIPDDLLWDGWQLG
ncbi:MAG: hypothetical protein QOK15_3074 [Nocardioidaceae bacterium]|jgi:hypothetical protein|nr:hypothetical protein [Nocardioidaceae bacterium]